jgi:hypothetical protein
MSNLILFEKQDVQFSPAKADAGEIRSISLRYKKSKQKLKTCAIWNLDIADVEG